MLALINIQLTHEGRTNSDELLKQLEADGFQLYRNGRATGIISGWLEESAIPYVRTLSGVKRVALDREVSIDR